MRPYTRHDVSVWTIQRGLGATDRLDLAMLDGSMHTVEITAGDLVEVPPGVPIMQLAIDRVNAKRNAAPIANAQVQCADPTHDHRAVLRIQTYKAKDGWRWRMKAVNGRTVATSGEKFAKRFNAERAAARFVGAAIEMVEA